MLALVFCDVAAADGPTLNSNLGLKIIGWGMRLLMIDDFGDKEKS